MTDGRPERRPGRVRFTGAADIVRLSQRHFTGSWCDPSAISFMLAAL
jgi:hypothetical protein